MFLLSVPKAKTLTLNRPEDVRSLLAAEQVSRYGLVSAMER
jgi:hypothetical protein